MKFPLIIAFHFDKTRGRYGSGANRLKRRCVELNLRVEILQAENYIKPYIQYLRQQCPRVTSDRNRIVRWIPTFIKMKLYEHQEPLLYMHCDTIIQSLPDPSCFKPLSVGYSLGDGKYYGKRNRRNFKILASPVFFRPNETAFEFLDEWQQQCNYKNCEKGEHCWLQNLSQEFSNRDDVGPLPKNTSSKDHKTDAHFIF